MELPKLTIPGLPHFSASIFINTPVLLIVLLLFLILYAIITAVLYYHWLAYGMKSQGILVAETLFLFVSVVMFVISGLALYYF